eukprot:scaffold89598_cov66-Phaeocystis_antarctica.AAC.2
MYHTSHTQDSDQRRHTELGARESLRLAPQRGGEPLIAVAEALELARAHGLLLGVGALAQEVAAGGARRKRRRGGGKERCLRPLLWRLCPPEVERAPRRRHLGRWRGERAGGPGHGGVAQQLGGDEARVDGEHEDARGLAAKTALQLARGVGGAVHWRLARAVRSTRVLQVELRRLALRQLGVGQEGGARAHVDDPRRGGGAQRWHQQAGEQEVAEEVDLQDLLDPVGRLAPLGDGRHPGVVDESVQRTVPSEEGRCELAHALERGEVEHLHLHRAKRQLRTDPLGRVRELGQ